MVPGSRYLVTGNYTNQVEIKTGKDSKNNAILISEELATPSCGDSTGKGLLTTGVGYVSNEL